MTKPKAEFVLLHYSGEYYWAGSRETVEPSSVTSYFDTKQASKYDMVCKYTKTPEWYWSRVAMQRLVGKPDHGWVALTKEEFQQYKQEMKSLELLHETL